MLYMNSLSVAHPEEKVNMAIKLIVVLILRPEVGKVEIGSQEK